jgi:hypothetical protein
MKNICFIDSFLCTAADFHSDDMLRVLNSLPFMTDVADIIEGLE